MSCVHLHNLAFYFSDTGRQYHYKLPKSPFLSKHFFRRVSLKLKHMSTIKLMKENFNALNLRMDERNLEYSFWSEIPRKISADMTVAENEIFSQYDGFTYWFHKKLLECNNLNVLDLGSTKSSTALLSLKHSVTAIVLSGPNDEVSNVSYRIVDATRKYYLKLLVLMCL
jgi:hypothetical protein